MYHYVLPFEALFSLRWHILHFSFWG